VGPADPAGTPTVVPFAPGQPFGDRYTIVEEVGAGGMGHVYKAIDRQLGKTVALKLVRPAAAGQGMARERFRRELALAQAVTHPNVCRVHDLGEIGGALYISMEFVEGQTLDDLIQSVGHLSAKQTVALARQMCAGLQAIHERGIVHRDLKPGNIMVDRSGRPILMDFGLAFHQGRDRLTGAGSVLGTLAYLSPEQARGRTTDHRSDIYGLGLILFEMLTGRRPPGDGSSSPLALREPDEGCPPPSRLVSDVPSGLDAIVLRCLEREPERRFSSAAELEAALGGEAAGLKSGSAPAPRARPRRLRLGRSSGARTVAAAAACVLALAALWFWHSRPPASPPVPAPRPVIAVLPLDNVSKDTADEYLGVGVADSLITRLAAMPSVTVVSRSATLEQKGRPTRAVARDLGATYLVNGGVQRSDRTIHVTLNLVRPDDSVAWGREYESSLDDIFSLHRQAAEGLSEALKITLSEADRARLARAPTTDTEAFAVYSRARALVERPDVPGNVSRAIEAFQDAIRKDPKFALAHAGLGEAYWTQYQETKGEEAVTKARSEITEALRLDPDQPLTRFALARLYQGTGRPDEAIEELHRLLALQPGNDDAHRVLGDILLAKGRNEEALGELSKAVELRPDYWENHRILGRAYYQLGRYPDAVRALTRVTELQPDNSRGFQMLGAVYDKMGNDDQALVYYRRAIELNPDARAYSNLGTLYYRQGKFDEAAQAYSEAARLEPSPAKHRNLGDLYSRLGQRTRAREQYERAVELSQSILGVNPKDAHTLGLLAVSEAKLGRHDAAARHADEAVALAPLDAEVLYRKAVVAALAGRTGPALAALREALDHGYSAADAARDDDFGSLRDSQAFRRLVGRAPAAADKGGP
jgi:tetratricopeptide (TPR) repeat protein/TolB-like protein/tRNA A-37 threonylcarbamoyl transferase component Bud32